MARKTKIISISLGFVLAIGLIVYGIFINRPTEPEPYEEIAAPVVQEPEPIVIEYVPEYEEEEEPEPLEVPVDFEYLRQINPDIYAWIYIPGTRVDYPILQSVGEDQEFYLYHTYDGLPGAQGSVFTQDYNAKDFFDRNTILYGHDMRNEAIFGSLRNYKDEEYRRANDTIIIYTPVSIMEYRIVSVVIFDDRHLMYAFDFEDDIQFMEFIEELLDPIELIYWSEGVEITTDDRIITLSTCTVAWDQRLFVIAVLEEYVLCAVFHSL